MAIESNIEGYYWELIDSLADRAEENIKEWEGDEDESEPIWQAIDDGLIYYVDQAYIVAHMVLQGVISWNEAPAWETITEELFNDIAEELNGRKKTS